MPLRAALQTRQPTVDLIIHSDRSGQCLSNEVRELISLWRMSRAEDPYDNAFAESFWSRLKAELLEGGCFWAWTIPAQKFLTGPPVRYIECYYNRQDRLCSTKALIAGL